KVSLSETASMWQSLSFGPNYKAAYCLAVCPAGDDVIGPFLNDRKTFLKDTVLDTDENDPLHRQASFVDATTRPQQPGSWTHRHARTPAHAPRTGAVRYTHKLSSRSDTRAGARERAGFIDAPEIGPANSASRAITDPTATPASTPFSFEPVETLRMTNISSRARTASRANDWAAPPAGRGGAGGAAARESGPHGARAGSAP